MLLKLLERAVSLVTPWLVAAWKKAENTPEDGECDGADDRANATCRDHVEWTQYD
jgi:hypothetical protein